MDMLSNCIDTVVLANYLSFVMLEINHSLFIYVQIVDYERIMSKR